MKTDHLQSYLDSFTVNVRRYIPSFAEACQLQIADPSLFDECIFTRTFVAFGPERRFKLHTIEDIGILRETPIIDGFPEVTTAAYGNIRSKEYELNERLVLDIQEPFNQSGTDILWDLLEANGEAEIVATYMYAKFNEEQRESGKALPLVWIHRQGPATPYLSPLRVGTRSYYIAVGEDRIDRRTSERDAFTFLHLAQRE